jgi:hypothetical protein
MSWKIIVKIAGYIALVSIVGLCIYGSVRFYFFKPTPNVQNFAPESKPIFNTTHNNMEYHWAIGPYIEAENLLEDIEWGCGLRLEYRF